MKIKVLFLIGMKSRRLWSNFFKEVQSWDPSNVDADYVDGQDILHFFIS
jgi:hypothetical protein